MIPYNKQLEKQFVLSRDKLRIIASKESNVSVKRNYFKNFISQTERDNKDLIVAIKEKILSIIKNFEPEEASKLITELFWTTKRELLIYEKSKK
jgi:hypothetical protein